MIIVGHRGAKGLAAENTASSIQRALECGVDEVEIDVRVTKDGIPILSHGSFVGESPDLRPIANLTLAEIKKIKPDATTLHEALRMTSGQAGLYIEVKHGEPTSPVVQVITSYIEQPGVKPQLFLASKSQRVLRGLHTALPDIPKIVIESWSGVRATWRARQVATKRISMRSWWLWTGFLRSMHRRGYQIVPYTINDPQRIAKWQPYIYGVVTDNPDRFQQYRDGR